jgi:hypothetical protein
MHEVLSCSAALLMLCDRCWWVSDLCTFVVFPLQERIQTDIIEWLRFLKQSIGFDGWRFDFVRGYDGRFCKTYTDATVSNMAQLAYHCGIFTASGVMPVGY